MATAEGQQEVHAGPNDSWHGVVAPGTRFPPEAGRYHLYIGLFCPFAHRANLVRHLKGLESAIPLSVVKPYPKGDDKGWPGWQFPGCQGPDDVYEGATPDHLFGSKYMHEVYFKADADYKGRYSVPVLWDTREGTIVNNESAELLRWLPTAFNDILPEGSPERELNLYPQHLQAQIDEISQWMQRDLNSGVYKAGFATSQEAYDENVPTVFAALNHLEQLIFSNGGPYILGKELTELDIRAYATIVRFDVVYVQHFKCNLGTIRGNYPIINEWLKNLYWNVKGFKETTNFRHIKENYTKSHEKINPLAITPMGPFPHVEEGVDLDFTKLKPGSIKHPKVLERQKELYK
ncbi:glutathione S-transferase [Xylariales sp. PMI_506]|nr:glutathione S-transferase [Xylariales sp. PMI_506]